MGDALSLMGNRKQTAKIKKGYVVHVPAGTILFANKYDITLFHGFAESIPLKGLVVSDKDQRYNKRYVEIVILGNKPKNLPTGRCWCDRNQLLVLHAEE